MSDKRQYSVSVIIPAYNVEDYIAQAIDSVLAQWYPPEEVIVVDDGSTDDTADIVKRYGGIVRYIYQENAGPGAARNRGINAAKGQWIAFLDADDAWLPDKLKSQIELLKRNPDLQWAGANFIFRHVRNRIEHLSMEAGQARTLLGERDYFDNFLDMIMLGVSWTPSILIIHRSVFQIVGGYHGDIHFGEDIELCMRIACHWPRFGYCAEPLMVYSQHRTESLTNILEVIAKSQYMFHVFDIHLVYTRRYGQYDAFCRFALWNLRRIIYDVVLCKRYDLIRYILSRYHALLPVSIKAVLTLLSAYSLIDILYRKRIMKILFWRFIIDFKFTERLYRLLKVGQK